MAQKPMITGFEVIQFDLPPGVGQRTLDRGAHQPSGKVPSDSGLPLGVPAAPTPSVTSSSVPSVLPSSTEITPSWPTRSNASAIIVPISVSCAEMVATAAVSSCPSTWRAVSSRWSVTASTAVGEADVPAGYEVETAGEPHPPAREALAPQVKRGGIGRR